MFFDIRFIYFICCIARAFNSYTNKSWADSSTYFGDILKNYYIRIQDKSQSGLELPPEIVENSEGVNQTGNGLTEQVLSGEGDSEDNNQSSTQTTSDQTLSGEGDSEDNNLLNSDFRWE